MSEGDSRREGEARERPKIRLQRPGQDTPVASELDLGEAGAAQRPDAARARPRTRTEPRPTARPRRRGEGAAEKDPTPGLPLVASSTFLLLLGALLLGAYWLGGFFTSPAVQPGAWPWEVFRDADGAFTFAWRPDPVNAALGAFYVLFFLIAGLTPARRGRGVAVLVVASLAVVMLPVDGPLLLLFALPLLLSLALAGQAARIGLGAGLAVAFASAVMLAANLFAPLGPADQPWTAPAVDLYRQLFEQDQMPFLDVLQRPDTPVVLMGVVLGLLSVLVLLGIRGRWVLWTAGVALLIGILGPPALTLKSLLAAGSVPSGELLAFVTDGLPMATLAFALPVAAGITDAARREPGG